MVIKYLSRESCRVIYITEVGIKVFDMEFFRNDNFKLHYCVDAINRKVIIQTLKNDIGLMLTDIPLNKKIILSEDRKQNKTLIKSTAGITTSFYLLNNASLRMEEILTKKNFQKKVVIQYFSNNRSELDSVRISHYNLRLNIQLSQINETRSDVSE